MMGKTIGAGTFHTVLEAALDHDDEAAMDIVMKEVQDVAERVGNRCIYNPDLREEFPGWVAQNLLERRRRSRAAGKRSDPLTYAGDVVRELHADKDEETQRNHFRGIIGHAIGGTILVDYLRIMQREAEKRNSIIVEGIDVERAEPHMRPNAAPRHSDDRNSP